MAISGSPRNPIHQHVHPGIQSSVASYHSPKSTNDPSLRLSEDVVESQECSYHRWPALSQAPPIAFEAASHDVAERRLGFPTRKTGEVPHAGTIESSTIVARCASRNKGLDSADRAADF